MLIKAMPLVVSLGISAGVSAAPPDNNANLRADRSTTFGQTLFTDRHASSVSAESPVVMSSQPPTAEARLPSAHITSRAPAPAPLSPASQAIAVGTRGASAGNERAVVAEGRESFNVWGFSIKITDFLLVIFTGALAWFTYLLWRSTKNLWLEAKDSRSISEASANAAVKSAHGALRSAEVAARAHDARWIITSMHIDERLRYAEDGTEYQIVATLKNCGQTPAEITRTAFYAWLSPKFDPATEDLAACTKPELLFGKLVEPGKTIEVTTEINLTVEKIQSIRDGTTRLWAWGSLSYQTYLDESMVKGFVGLLDEASVRWHGDASDDAILAGPLCPPPLRVVRGYVGTVPDPDGRTLGTGLQHMA